MTSCIAFSGGTEQLAGSTFSRNTTLIHSGFYNDPPSARMHGQTREKQTWRFIRKSLMPRRPINRSMNIGMINNFFLVRNVLQQKHPVCLTDRRSRGNLPEAVVNKLTSKYTIKQNVVTLFGLRRFVSTFLKIFAV